MTFGRSDDTSRKVSDDPLDMAISQLETGVLLMSAIRDTGTSGDTCSAKLACKLGQITRNSFDSPNMIIDAVSFIAPSLSNKYSNFTESFSKVARSEDESSCAAECSRCLVI